MSSKVAAVAVDVEIDATVVAVVVVVEIDATVVVGIVNDSPVESVDPVETVERSD